uniref:G_PROTEIN_RECEP_F1_2 domain-containing protein n=1 Tax=Rhabditophanes sp. KR3021 TaxID=114890 RepID=A0AC35THR2_9BILA
MNKSEIINYYWAPINKMFLPASLQVQICLPFFLIPNFYFLMVAMTNESIKKRTWLRNAMLYFPIIILTTGFVTLAIQFLYLSTYFSGGLMNVELCSVLRTTQAFLRALVASSPFIFSVFRYMRVFYKIRYDTLIAVILMLFLNGITLVSVIVNFFSPMSASIHLNDEVCTYMRIFKSNAIATSVEVLAFSVPIVCPILGVLINILFLHKLRMQTCDSGSANTSRVNRSVAINLMCNSIEPFLAQFPSTLYFILTDQNTKSSFIVWRLIDGLTCFSYAFSTIASIILIKDIRQIYVEHKRYALASVSKMFHSD